MLNKFLMTFWQTSMDIWSSKITEYISLHNIKMNLVCILDKDWLYSFFNLANKCWLDGCFGYGCHYNVVSINVSAENPSQI